MKSILEGKHKHTLLRFLATALVISLLLSFGNAVFASAGTIEVTKTEEDKDGTALTNERTMKALRIPLAQRSAMTLSADISPVSRLMSTR